MEHSWNVAAFCSPDIAWEPERECADVAQSSRENRLRTRAYTHPTGWDQQPRLPCSTPVAIESAHATFLSSSPPEEVSSAYYSTPDRLHPPLRIKRRELPRRATFRLNNAPIWMHTTRVRTLSLAKTWKKKRAKEKKKTSERRREKNESKIRRESRPSSLLLVSPTSHRPIWPRGFSGARFPYPTNPRQCPPPQRPWRSILKSRWGRERKIKQLV